LVSLKSSPPDFSTSFDPSQIGDITRYGLVFQSGMQLHGEQSHWRSYQCRLSCIPGEMNEDKLSPRSSALGPTRPERATRIRTSSLTNGRWRLNQSGEIWLSRTSATRHVAWLYYLCVSTRSRFWIRAERSEVESGTAFRFIESRYSACLLLAFWFAGPRCRKSIC